MTAADLDEFGRAYAAYVTHWNIFLSEFAVPALFDQLKRFSLEATLAGMRDAPAAYPQRAPNTGQLMELVALQDKRIRARQQERDAVRRTPLPPDDETLRQQRRREWAEHELRPDRLQPLDTLAQEMSAAKRDGASPSEWVARYLENLASKAEENAQVMNGRKRRT
jgi:hypothetical protein